MLQRVVIAMALAAEPALLILDEPTTALDATVEAEVLDLVSALKEEFRTSVLFISHNLAVIAKMCDRVGVLYAGDLVEEGPALAGVRGASPSLHGRPAPLHPAARAPEGPRPARHDSRASCPRRAPSRRRASSPPVARSLRKGAGPRRPRSYQISPERRSRCFFWERAPQLQRRTPVDVTLPAAADDWTGRWCG